MRRSLLLYFIVVTAIAADNESAPSQSIVPQSVPVSGKPIVPPPSLDPSFFNKPKGLKASETRGDRYHGADPDYNSEQLQQWKDECRKEMKKGMAEFRKCFNTAKSRDLGAIQQQRIEVERRQSLPLTNVPEPVQKYEQTPSDE